MIQRLLWLLVAVPLSLWAQFDLYLVKDTIEAPAPQIVDFGAGYPGEAASIRFRLRNNSDQTATLAVPAVDGSGFSLSGALPVSTAIDSKASLDFTVIFQAINIGSYSATLRAGGVSTLLTAGIRAGLTPEIDSGGAALPLGAVVFPAVELGTSADRTIILENLTAQVLTVPAIAIQGNAFRLAGESPGGTVLQTRQSARFVLRFQPAAAGTHAGALVIGDRSYALSGTSVNPALPKPAITLSAGAAIVQFDAPARIAGSGLMTLEFQPLSPGSTDPAIAFLSGARTFEFTFTVGDRQAPAAEFRNGTTAGTIIFTVSLGGATARESITIAPQPVAILSAQGSRQASSVQIAVAGADNTRTVGPLVYTFYDVSGATLATIPVDASADFAKYFQGSDAGGNFLLRCVFPVTGETSRIAAYELSLTNSIGVTRTGRISF